VRALRALRAMQSRSRRTRASNLPPDLGSRRAYHAALARARLDHACDTRRDVRRRAASGRRLAKRA
jgi:hypothetical protein